MTESDLLKVRSFGRISLREVKRKLADLGLTLGMSFSESGAVIPPEHPPTVEEEDVGEEQPEAGPEGGDNPTMPASMNNY
jgi:hypothetical protein